MGCQQIVLQAQNPPQKKEHQLLVDGCRCVLEAERAEIQLATQDKLGSDCGCTTLPKQCTGMTPPRC